MLETWLERHETILSLIPSLASAFGIRLPINERARCKLIDSSINKSQQDDYVSEDVDLLQQSLIKLSDFITLSTLTSSGPFTKVQLVSTKDGIGAHQSVLVMKTSQRTWAYKMRKQQSPVSELSILLLASYSHKNPPIPRILAAFLSPLDYHIVLEYATGGDLGSYLDSNVSAAVIEERLAKRWVAEAVEAIIWLNDVGWVHRDIKPQNFLITKTGRILLTDFNSAAPLSDGPSTSLTIPNSSISARCMDRIGVAREYALSLIGTPDYIAPEILKVAESMAADSFSNLESEKDSAVEIVYGKGVDCWSLGVMIYEILYGQAPFYAEEIVETYERIINHANTLVFPVTPIVSGLARDLIKRLLTSAEDRISIIQTREHAWIAGEAWGKFSEVASLYIPPPSNSPRQSLDSPEPCTFDFSAFFSSPGLSALRVNSQPLNQNARKEEEKYWCGMTWIPEGNAFDSLEIAVLPPKVTTPDIRQAPLTAGKPFRRPFETPARKTSMPTLKATAFSASMTSQFSLVPGGSTTKAKRMVTEVEGWKEMLEHSFAVGMSARAISSRPSKLDLKQRREAGMNKEVLKKDFQQKPMGALYASSDLLNNCVSPSNVLDRLEEGSARVVNILDEREEIVDITSSFDSLQDRQKDFMNDLDALDSRIAKLLRK